MDTFAAAAIVNAVSAIDAKTTTVQKAARRNRHLLS
jgi:hypothetical protein